jgi:hypothetical protein
MSKMKKIAIVRGFDLPQLFGAEKSGLPHEEALVSQTSRVGARGVLAPDEAILGVDL